MTSIGAQQSAAVPPIEEMFRGSDNIDEGTTPGTRGLIWQRRLPLSLTPADAEEMRFASWPEVIAMMPCERIGRDEAGGLVVLGPINVEEKHFSARAVTSPFEATEIRDRCFKGGRRLHHHDAYRPYYSYRYGHLYYYSPGPFLVPEPPG